MSHNLPSLFLGIAKAIDAVAVSPLSLAVLAAVADSPGKRPTDITLDYFPGMAKADLSVFLSRLEVAGLVVKVNSPYDKRAILVFPTDKGKKALQDALKVFQGLGIGLILGQPTDAPRAP